MVVLVVPVGLAEARVAGAREVVERGLEAVMRAMARAVAAMVAVRVAAAPGAHLQGCLAVDTAVVGERSGVVMAALAMVAVAMAVAAAAATAQ